MICRRKRYTPDATAANRRAGAIVPGARRRDAPCPKRGMLYNRAKIPITARAIAKAVRGFAIMLSRWLDWREVMS